MNNQEILNTLAELEQEFFYRYSGGADREGVNFDDCQELHEKIGGLLLKWHRITGLKVD